MIGLGTMGAGIAEVLAAAGRTVIGVDADQAALDRGRTIVETSTGRALERDKITADQRTALTERISYHTDFAAVADAEVVIEAVSENLELKRSIFTRLGEVARPETLLATNTSSLPITDIAVASGRADRVVGVHFFNPAPVQRLVEVVKTVLTAPSAQTQALELVNDLGKTPILCGDRAGFVVNALLVPYLNRAARLYQDGCATAAQIDEAMVAAGNPMGPLALIDLVGLDVTVSALDRMYSETRDRRHAPVALLAALVSAGRLGRKTGQGILLQAEPRPAPLIDRSAELPDALLLPYLNDVCRMVEIGYATPEVIDTGMSLGCRMPRPFDVLADLGPAAVLAGQQQIFAATAEPGDRPALLLERLAAAPDPAAALTELRAMA
ncbi:3-hydroxybutyryl-CoA dehydrogenase [Microlunatus soli]|uniref:3-hydroxybutyryl-CoA dehydrogenase n=1 Tax=Microlunatus soli TaxID=630515 RepID=A0A1H1ZWB7_9ACTN|nr:3-hydroxybutyryl-CoA dehydrogenase [Microlunatus soli]